jgi:putative ABC transport system permease protein
MIISTAWKNLTHKPLSALLSWLLLTASVAIISLLILLQGQFEEKFTSSIRGVDMVMGAKGSPLQLILSAVYHIDNPTGNIDYETAQKWMKHPFVEKAIPLAYGDSYKGYSVLGTTPDYIEKYKAEVVEGRMFQGNFEVVIGADLAKKLRLSIGSTFNSTHGSAENGEEHTEHAYKVVGLLKPTDTVIDNLIVGTIESVWAMHDHGHEGEEEAHEEHEHKAGEAHDHEGHNHEEGEAHDHESEHEKRQITAVLFKFRSPMALVQWPRMISQNTDLQIVSPAIEINRLFSLFGIGLNALQYLGLAIMFLSGLSVFVSLFNTLKERRYELALLRTMGAARGQLFLLVLLESLWLCLAGFVSGILLSRVALWLIAQATERTYRIRLDQFGLHWPEEGWLFALTLGIGVLAALIPAFKAYRLNISNTLAHD